MENTIYQEDKSDGNFARQEAAYRLEERGAEPSPQEIDAVAKALYQDSERWIDGDAVCEIVEDVIYTKTGFDAYLISFPLYFHYKYYSQKD